MNLSRIYLIAIFVMAFGAHANGQETLKAVLVDEHGLLACDESLSRVDRWYSELGKNPKSTGLAVIASPPGEKHLGVFRQLMMELHAKFRRADRLSIKYLRTTSNSEFKVQMWQIPVGADAPEIENVDMSFILPKDIEPFILAITYELDEGPCPTGNDLYVFSKFLKANPSSRGNIVVREGTVGRARRTSANILREFTRRYGIPGSRLRLFPENSPIL